VAEVRGIAVQRQPRQIVHEPLSQKYPVQKRAGGVAEAVQHLPSKHKTLSSNPNTIKIISQTKKIK
jgi:hypothetical protein